MRPPKAKLMLKLILADLLFAKSKLSQLCAFKLPPHDISIFLLLLGVGVGEREREGATRSPARHTLILYGLVSSRNKISFS